MACLSLLAVQVAGLHMHVDARGYTGTPQGTHFHGQSARADEHPGPDAHHEQHRHEPHERDHDHDGDRDVSVSELGAGGSKLTLPSTGLGLRQIMPLARGEKLLPPPDVRRPVRRQGRWRPPLRAPPPSSR